MYKSVLLLFIFPIVFSASVSLESSSEVSNVEEKKQLLNPDGEITIEKKNVDPIEEFFNKAVLVKVDKYLPHDYEFGPPREKLVAIGSRGSINGKSINKIPIVEDELDENTSEIIIEKSVNKKTDALKSLFKDNLSDYSNELKGESIHTQETTVKKSPETEIIIHKESFINGVIKDISLDKETTVKIYLDKEEINSEKSLNKQIKIEESLLDERTSNTRLDLDANIKSDYKEESDKKSDGWKVPKEKFLTEEPIEKSQFLKRLPISLFSLRKRKPKILEEDNNKLILKKAITKLKFDLPKIDFESLLESSQFRGKSTSTNVIPSASKSVDVPIPTKSSDVVTPIIKFIDVTIPTSTSITPKPETITTTTYTEATSISTPSVATVKSTIQETSRSPTEDATSRSPTEEASSRSPTEEVTSRSPTEDATLRSPTEEATTTSEDVTTKSTRATEATFGSTTIEKSSRSTAIVATINAAPIKVTSKSTTTKSTTRSTNEEILRSTTKETTLKSTTRGSSTSLSSVVCGEHCGLDGTFSITSGLDWSHELDNSSALDLFKNVSREIVVDLIRIFKHSSIGSSFRSVHINSIYPVSDLIIVDIYLRLHGINLDVTADDVKAVFSEGLVNSTLGRFAIEESRTEFLVSVDRAPRRKVNKLEILDIFLPDWAWMGIGVLTVSVSFIGILGIVFACNRRNNIRNVPVVSPSVLAHIRKKMSLDGICDDSFTEDIIQDIRSSVSGCSHLHRASVRRGDIFQDIRSSVSGISHPHRDSVKRGDIGSSHLHRAGLRDETVYRSRSRSEGSGTYLQNVNRQKLGNFNRDSYRPGAATYNDGPRAATDSYGPRDSDRSRAATDSYGPRDSYRLRAATDSYRPRDSCRSRAATDSYRPRAATDSYRPRAATDSDGPRAAMENYGPRDSYRPRAATENYGPRDSYRTTGYQRGTSRDLQINHKNVLINRSNQQINSKSTNAKNIYRQHEPNSQRQSVSRIPSVSSYDCRRPSVSSNESRRLSVSSCDSGQQLVSSSDEEIISSNIFTNESNQRNGNRRGRNDQNRCQVQRQVMSSGDEETVYDGILANESYRNEQQVGKETVYDGILANESYRNEQQVEKVKRFAYTKDSWSGGVYAVPARKRRTPLPGFEIPRWEADLPITPVTKSTTESSNASGSSLESPSNMVRMLSYRKI